jgi:hypothetical protein
VTFWQALGLLALARILFGGLGCHQRHGGFRMRDKWERMTPEERDRFRDGMRRRWGGVAPPAGETPITSS